MQKPTSLFIPQPCQEEWSRMTPTQQGKFCAACSKQVINFSLMTDQQIVNFLSSHNGSLCGRFHQEQLERTLVERKNTKRKSLWLAFALPFVVLFQKSFGQKAVLHKTETAAQNKDVSPVTILITGMTARRYPKPKILHGKVTDEKNNPIPYATIMMKETGQKRVSDSSGIFSFDVMKDDSVTLLAESIGYQTIEKQVRINDSDKQVSLVMQMQPATLGEVVITAYPSYVRSDRMGAVSVCSKITKTEKIDSSFRKILRINSYNIYPNPATKGSLVHIKMKQRGSYELQLLDNKSGLLRSQHENKLADNTTVSFAIPETISSGIYYLRIICSDKNKSSLEKLIIQ